MKNDKRSHHHDHDSQPFIRTNLDPNEKDPEDLENDKWKPSPAQFEAFLDRDFELAQDNIAAAMLSRGLPMSIKEIKDSCLHGMETIERVLTSKVISGLIRENSGRYELVK